MSEVFTTLYASKSRKAELINHQFIMMAVAKKISALETEAFFANA